MGSMHTRAAVATQTGERRRHRRIPLNARIRVRPAGGEGAGHACRVHDASTGGVRLAPEGPADPGWDRLEVLTHSGRRCRGGLELRVVWMERLADGTRHVGCAFES